MGCEKRLPGTAGRSQGLGFRTGVQAAGNACPSSGTEAFGMVLLRLFLTSTRHSTHDSAQLGAGGGTLIQIPPRLYMAVGREEIGRLVGGRRDAGFPQKPPNVRFVTF